MSDPRRVLLVDDDDASRITLAALLEDSGHVVIEADGVTTGADCIRAQGPFDVVVLDQNLPDGMGLDLLGDLGAHAPAAKVLIVSGDPRPGVLPNGIAGYLEKGGDPARMVGAIVALLT